MAKADPAVRRSGSGGKGGSVNYNEERAEPAGFLVTAQRSEAAMLEKRGKMSSFLLLMLR